MASPPAGSPPSSSNLSLPRQRPTLGLSLPTSRKPSMASTPSAHPLRQTSFPPEAADPQYSPTGSASLDGFSDTEIQSAISGPVTDESFTGKKRKRPEKRGRGRPSKNSSSLANGEDGRTSRRGDSKGAPSVVTADGAEAPEEEEDDDDEEEAAAALADRDGASQIDLKQDNQHRYLFREAVGDAHQNRYDAFNKVKLKTTDVRRLVNATLSQSVPANVVTVVQSYTKMFAGMLIESAREVQTEWMAINEKMPDETENRAYKRLKMMHEETEEELDIPGDTQPNSSSDEKPNGTADKTTNGEPKPDEFSHVQPGAWGLSSYLDECDRGPLLPDHLREALRRYKKARSGGTVGFTGISLERPEIAAPRMGGKRLFK